MKLLSCPTLVCLILGMPGAALAQTRPATSPATQPATQPMPATPARDSVERLLNIPVPVLARAETVGPLAITAMPADDAPIELLAAYWDSAQAERAGYLRCTPAVRQRLLDWTLADPWTRRLNYLCVPDDPKSLERVKAAIAAMAAEPGVPAAAFEDDRRGLMMSDPAQVKRLTEAAAAIAAADRSGSWMSGGYVEGWDLVEALVQRDWATAKGLLDRWAGGDDAVLRAKATLLIHRTARQKDEEIAKPYFEMLKRVAGDGDTPRELRLEVLRIVMAADWPGRDDWFVSLLADRDIDVSAWIEKEPDRWVPRLIRQLNDERLVMRAGAARALAVLRGRQRKATPSPGMREWDSPLRIDAQVALLPILRDPARYEFPEDKRDRGLFGRNEVATYDLFLQTLRNLKLPEAIKPLEAALAAAGDGATQELLDALVFQGSKAGIDALLKRREDGAEHDALVALRTGRPEQVGKCVEAYARYRVTPRDGTDLLFGEADEPEGDAAVGKAILEMSDPADPCAGWLCRRAGELRGDDRLVGEKLDELMADWSSPEVDRALIERLKHEADYSTVRLACRRVETLRAGTGRELREVTALGGRRGAAAAALLGDVALCRQIIAVGDPQAQAMVLAVARLLRLKLAEGDAGAVLKSEDALARRAADDFLVALDTLAARKLLWAAAPAQARVIGSSWGLYGAADPATPWSKGINLQLQREVLAAGGPDEIHFLRVSGQSGYSDLKIVIRGQSAALIATDGNRRRDRVMTADELREFQGFLKAIGAESMPPVAEFGVDAPITQYLHITRDGGRQILLGYPTPEDGLTPHSILAGKFAELSSGRTGRISYEAMERQEKLSIAFSSPKVPWEALDVWKHGDDLRVLAKIGRPNSWSDNRQWLSVRDGRPAGSAQPPATAINADKWSFDRSYVDESELATLWRRRAGKEVIAATDRGLVRRGKDHQPVQVADGRFADVVVSADGRWCLALGCVGRETKSGLHRFDLSTGQRLAIAQAFETHALTWLPVVNQFVAFGWADPETRRSKAALIDPATGGAQEVGGYAESLHKQKGRPWQVSADGKALWAVLPDEPNSDGTGHTWIARYDLRTHRAEMKGLFYGLRSSNDTVWVDEAEGAAYAAVGPEVLRIALDFGRDEPPLRR